MNLWDLQSGDIVVVDGVALEVDQKIRDRLEEMGLSNSLPVTCMRRSPLNGPIVVRVGGSVFALEQDIAQQIRVKPC